MLTFIISFHLLNKPDVIWETPVGVLPSSQVLTFSANYICLYTCPLTAMFVLYDPTPLITADWTRHEHLIQLSQSDSLLGIWICD